MPAEGARAGAVPSGVARRRGPSRAGRTVQMAPTRVERSESGLGPVWASARSGVVLIVILVSRMVLRGALRSALRGATVS